MNTRETFIKNIFTVLILFTLPVTSVYAVHDPNSLLNGVYATNSKWQCIASGTPFTNDPSNSVTEVFSTAGEITYFGDGTASEVGRVGITTSDGFADINPYTCDWTYQVNDDGAFTLEADCELSGSIFGPPEPLIGFVTNQKWFGHIGMGQTAEMLLIERHDGEIEGISDDGGVTNFIDRVCGKTGTQIKIRDLNPQPIIDPGPPANPGSP